MRWSLQTTPPACCLTEAFIFQSIVSASVRHNLGNFSCVYGKACKIALDENTGSQYLKTFLGSPPIPPPIYHLDRRRAE